jgi:putative acetyltransferase
MAGKASEDPDYLIRPIRVADNPAVAGIIRQVMTEFGATGCGYSIGDAEVDAMFEAYPAPAAAFFVVERAGKVLGCGGVAPLQGGEPGVCELRKMYFLPELRGSGMGHRLLGIILERAQPAIVLLETRSHGPGQNCTREHGFAPVCHPAQATHATRPVIDS